MKKFLSCVLGLAMAISALGTSAYAADAEVESEIVYNQTFTQPASVNDLSKDTAGVFEANPAISYDAAKGAVVYDGWASRGAWLLPESVNVADFVMEADISYKKKDNYANTGIGFGFVFDYQDSNNSSWIAYYPLNDDAKGNVNKYDAIAGTVTGRNAEKGRGSSLLLAEDTPVHLKLIVNKGLIEFFVDGELTYTYYSPDDSRATTNIAANQRANNYAKSGRLGIFSQADKVQLTVDNVRVRTVGTKDIAYYSNAFIDPNMEFKFSSFSKLSSYFPNDTFSKGSWGVSTYQGSGWSNIGQYITVPVSGDYMIDVDFSMNNPLNATRWMGIAFGINANEDGTMTYNAAGIHENGTMFLTQKAVTYDSSTETYTDNNISGAQAVYGDCISTISADKKNADYDGETNEYFLSYKPADYTYVDIADVISKRHKMRITVVDGVASFTFGGKTISCEIDTNETDGYVGLRSAGTASEVYSVRVAPYYVDEPVVELDTTMEFNYTDIGSESALADIIVNDDLNLVDENSRVIVAVYDNGKLVGTDIQPVDDEITYLEAIYDTVSDTSGLTIRAFLWDMVTGKPLAADIIPE
ncbi:MAG: hypothetical protein J6C82_00355 [Clostridia bacterium]|nr:hypothetical protein [Clostridia bacterium]